MGGHVDIGAVEAGGLLRTTKIRDTGSAFDISLPTEPGFLHSLESKDAMQTTTWVVVGSVTGDGGVLTISDPRPRVSNRIYRLVMTP